MQKKEILNQESAIKQVTDKFSTEESQLRKSEEMNNLFNRISLQKGYNPEGLPINMDEFPIEVRGKLKELYAEVYPQGMNLFALNGDKVTFLGIERGGSNEDRTNAQLYLKKGDVYTVKTTFTNDYLSYVVLEEFPESIFNTMYFRNWIN